MSIKKQERAAGSKQKTAKGHEVPVPKRKDFTDALKKVAPPVKPKPKR